jgi:orotate phosphoribosyltransferase
MKEKIAGHLLQIKAVFLRPNEPFIWASGIKSPIYCDNRLILSYPDIRKDIEKGLATLIKEKYPDCEAVFGTSTAGIPHAAIIADILNIPMGYVRSDSKDHGRNNQIEGIAQPGTKVVVIEDLISTAGSALNVCTTLREVGCEVLGIASIFTYDMKKGMDKLNEASIINYSLTDLDTLVDVALHNGMIDENDKAKLLAFRDNPADESWILITA